MRSQMIKGFEVACINENAHEEYGLMPEFLFNDRNKGKKVLTSIEKELRGCDEFAFSVAFITEGGVAPVSVTLEELENNNISGRIITTDYQHFSEPKALKQLSKFKNLEIRMYRTKNSHDGFHTKGYLFKNNETNTFIIGSSNWTQAALTTNKEWNCKLVCLDDGIYPKMIFEEFEEIWENSEKIDDCIEDYEMIYDAYKTQRYNKPVVSLTQNIKPNSMQIELIKNITNLMDRKETKALLISATATGKTYASAFTIQAIKPRRILFLVHREQIAKKALESYQTIFKETKSYGLISGNKKEVDKEYIFSTMQMMSKEEIHTQFNPNEFDFIVIDEAHRIGSESYQKIMNYFKPQFCLGMTATPERSDGYDVYKAFDNNIAHEIRLHHALADDLITPFNYFGISDIFVDSEKIEDTRQFSHLVCEERVKHIIRKASLYGYSGNRVKGLVFCSSNKEAKELSQKFNERAFRTVALSGEDTVVRREECVQRLVGDNKDYLDYIFTVDIFNEGIDIPEVNQVIMLRPTQSPIVFIQQLGRGLRKASNKEYVNILDFIGNYSNNYMIPIALSEDRTFSKDNIRRFLTEGIKTLPGSSTVHFDKISKDRIFESIDNANLNDLKLIKEAYFQLKQKIGRIPRMVEFETYEELDLSRIFQHSVGSYQAFLEKYEEDYTIKFNVIQLEMVKYLSRLVANGKRIHEIVALELLLNSRFTHDIWCKEMKENYGIELCELDISSVNNILSNQFLTGSSTKSFKNSDFIDHSFNISANFKRELQNIEFKNAIIEILEFSKIKYRKNYKLRYENANLCLYEKYTYEDVCRLLNWEKGEVPLNIGGYKLDKYSNTYPVFINYEKSDDIADTIKYEDRFINPKHILAISKAGRKIESDDVAAAVNAEQLGISMHLFVRKNKEDKTSKEFYYLGKIKVCEAPVEFIMPNTSKTAVELVYELKTSVKEELYDYLVGED